MRITQYTIDKDEEQLKSQVLSTLWTKMKSRKKAKNLIHYRPISRAVERPRT